MYQFNHNQQFSVTASKSFLKHGTDAFNIFTKIFTLEFMKCWHKIRQE